MLNLRVFGDENGKMWQKSVKDLSLEILSGSFSLIESMWRTIKSLTIINLVSQFTLHAVLRGNKPDFHLSMKADQSKEMYQQFVNELKKHYQEDKIKGSKYQVSNINFQIWKY